MGNESVLKTTGLSHSVTVFNRGDDTLESKQCHNTDDIDLIRLGKKPVLKRDFNLIQILGFSSTLLVTWEGAIILANPALENGGPAGVIWGFLFCWIGSTSAYVVLSELASIAPTSGGQYHWVALLSPARCKKFLSYVTGWVTILAWQAVNVSNAYLIGSMIEGTIALVQPSYVPKTWQSLLLSWAILLAALSINVVSTRLLARLEGVLLFAHLLGFIGILVPLLYYGPYASSSVFTLMNNAGGWSSDSLSFLIGFPTMVYSLFGADSVVHMSEEIRNASAAVPKTIFTATLINGALGWAALIALMFCVPDVLSSLGPAQKLGYAFLDIFAQAVRSPAGGAGMAAFILFMSFTGMIGCIAAASRLLWAFSRDRGLPGSGALSKVNSWTVLPLNALFTTLIIAMLVSLISLGTSVALNDVVSLTIAGMYTSYVVSAALLLYRRLQGVICPADSSDTPITGPDNLRWGSWKVPEPLGTINNAFACVYLAWMIFWGFWPPVVDPTASTMNFGVVVFSGVLIFSILWYLFRAHKYYVGPVVELT